MRFAETGCNISCKYSKKWLALLFIFRNHKHSYRLQAIQALLSATPAVTFPSAEHHCHITCPTIWRRKLYRRWNDVTVTPAWKA